MAFSQAALASEMGSLIENVSVILLMYLPPSLRCIDRGRRLTPQQEWHQRGSADWIFTVLTTPRLRMLGDRHQSPWALDGGSAFHVLSSAWVEAGSNVP